MIMIMSALISILRRHARPLRRLAAGETLFRTGARVVSLFEVVEGELHLQRVSAAGACLVLQRAPAGAILAEPSLFADCYHCDAVAALPALVRAAPVAKLRAELAGDVAAMTMLARHFAHEVQAARQRAEILALGRLAARLDAWLMLHAGRLPPRGQWLSLAAELAVTPEALYRELAKRRATRSTPDIAP